MLDEKFIYLAIVLIFVGDFSYLIYTLQGKVKPNRVTWLLWGLDPLIVFAAQISQGVGLISFTTFVFGAVPVFIFFASFLNKKAYWKLTKFDLTCGVLAIVGLVLWQITQVGNWAILFAIASEVFVTLPTIIKSYIAPETENYQVYLLNGLGAVIILFTIRIWDVAHIAYPIYVAIGGLMLFLLIKFKLGKKITKLVSVSRL